LAALVVATALVVELGGVVAVVGVLVLRMDELPVVELALVAVLTCNTEISRQQLVRTEADGTYCRGKVGRWNGLIAWNAEANYIDDVAGRFFNSNLARLAAKVRASGLIKCPGRVSTCRNA